MRLKRPLVGPDHPHGPSRGSDVTAVKRALARVEDDFFPRPDAGFDEVYNRKTVEAVEVFQQLNKLVPVTGYLNQQTLDELVPYMDAYARYLYWRYKVPTPTPGLVYPLPLGAKDYVGGLHPTAGLLGNWALDWIAHDGTAVLAVEDAKIAKLSGRDPHDDTWDTQGVYGWSIHYETRDGYRYFLTHMGKREPLVVGQRVLAGEKLGEIGDQRFRPDHLHLGVTSPLGESDAKKRIVAVAKAPRVAAT